MRLLNIPKTDNFALKAEECDKTLTKNRTAIE